MNQPRATVMAEERRLIRGSPRALALSLVFLFAFTVMKTAQWESWSISSGRQTSLTLPFSNTDVFMMSSVPSWPALVCSELSWCFPSLKIVICAQSGTFLGPCNFFLPFEPALVFWAAVNTSLANVVIPGLQVISVEVCVIS